MWLNIKKLLKLLVFNAKFSCVVCAVGGGVRKQNTAQVGAKCWRRESRKCVWVWKLRNGALCHCHGYGERRRGAAASTRHRLSSTRMPFESGATPCPWMDATNHPHIHTHTASQWAAQWVASAQTQWGTNVRVQYHNILLLLFFFFL